MDKKRSQNWTESERISAVELILDNADILFGRFKGATAGAKEKDAKWLEIVTKLNATGQTTVGRTVQEMKKMFTNVKARAKEKHSQNKRTGGGPNLPLTAAEDMVISYLCDRPQLEGIVGGIETTNAKSSTTTNTTSTTTTTPIVDKEDVTSSDAEDTPYQQFTSTGEGVLIHDVFFGDNIIDLSNISKRTDNKNNNNTNNNIEPPKKRQKKKTKVQSQSDELFAMEKKKLQMEMELIKQKKEHEIEFHTLKMHQQDELFNLKKSVLLTKQSEP